MRIAAALALMVFAVFGRTVLNGFINFDDDYYVTQNPIVQKGLSAEGLSWALTTADYFYWQPLTWLSHMLDCELYGLHPGGHHFTNVTIHALTAILAFAALFSLTGALWRSAFVAALFAIHPLRVESVAWVAERKDLLAGFFWFASILAYTFYVRRPTWKRYALVAAGFTLGLMSKPVMVTLPFALLLLDYWPSGPLSYGRVPTPPARKDPAAGALGGILGGDLPGSKANGRDGNPGACGPLDAGRQRNPLVRGVPRQDLLAAPAGAALSVRYAHRVAGAAGRGGPVGSRHRAGGSGAFARAVPARGLVVVHRGTGSHDRPGAGRRAIDGGSVHLHPLGGFVRNAGLGRLAAASESRLRAADRHWIGRSLAAVAGGGRRISGGFLAG